VPDDRLVMEQSLQVTDVATTAIVADRDIAVHMVIAMPVIVIDDSVIPKMSKSRITTRRKNINDNNGKQWKLQMTERVP